MGRHFRSEGITDSAPAGLGPKARLSGSRSLQQCSVCRGMPVHSEQDDCSFACWPAGEIPILRPFARRLRRLNRQRISRRPMIACCPFFGKSHRLKDSGKSCCLTAPRARRSGRSGGDGPSARGELRPSGLSSRTEPYFVPKPAAKGANTSLVNSLYKSLILLASATNVSYAIFAY